MQRKQFFRSLRCTFSRETQPSNQITSKSCLAGITLRCQKEGWNRARIECILCNASISVLTYQDVPLGPRLCILLLVKRLAMFTSGSTYIDYQCSMSSMQYVARCFEMQRVRCSVTLLSRLQRVALKNTQRIAQMTGSNVLSVQNPHFIA